MAGRGGRHPLPTRLPKTKEDDVDARRIKLSDDGAYTKFIDVLFKRKFSSAVMLEFRGGKNGLQSTAYMTPQEALDLTDAIHQTLDDLASGVMTEEEKALEHFNSLPCPASTISSP